MRRLGEQDPGCYWTNACQSCAIKHSCWLDEHPDKMRQRRETVEHPFGTIKRGVTSPHVSQMRLRSVKSAMMAPEKVDEMADDPCENPEVVVNTFLQHKSLEQMQDYLARGRRFTTFDVPQLTKDWITAVRSWLAHNDG